MSITKYQVTISIKMVLLTFIFRSVRTKAFQPQEMLLKNSVLHIITHFGLSINVWLATPLQAVDLGHGEKVNTDRAVTCPCYAPHLILLKCTCLKNIQGIELMIYCDSVASFVL